MNNSFAVYWAIFAIVWIVLMAVNGFLLKKGKNINFISYLLVVPFLILLGLTLSGFDNHQSTNYTKLRSIQNDYISYIEDPDHPVKLGVAKKNLDVIKATYYDKNESELSEIDFSLIQSEHKIFTLIK